MKIETKEKITGFGYVFTTPIAVTAIFSSFIVPAIISNSDIESKKKELECFVDTNRVVMEPYLQSSKELDSVYRFTLRHIDDAQVQQFIDERKTIRDSLQDIINKTPNDVLQAYTNKEQDIISTKKYADSYRALIPSFITLLPICGLGYYFNHKFEEWHSSAHWDLLCKQYEERNETI